MSGADCCGKVFLVIINIFFIILGVLSLGSGLFLKFGLPSLLFPTIDELPPTWSSSVDTQSGGSSSSASSSTSFDEGISVISELSSLVDMAAYVLVALGLFMLIVGVFGCAGACCSVTALLATYAAVVLLVFLAKVVMLGIWLGKTVDDKVFDALGVAVRTKYGGPTAANAESLLLNVIMIQLKCCGIETYKEFEEAAAWNRSIEYKANGGTRVFQQQIPITCCKWTGSLSAIKPNEANCTLMPTSVNSNIDTSCREAVQNEIDANRAAVLGIYSAILAFELICAAVAICLAVRTKEAKNRVGPSHDTSNVDSHNVHKY